MTWTPLIVEWKSVAKRDLGRLPKVTQIRVVAAVSRYATLGLGDVRRLRGAEGEYRLRVGSWRVRFQLERDRMVVLVLRVLHRSAAYRG